MADEFFKNFIDNNKLYTEGKTFLNIIQNLEENEKTVIDEY